MCCVVMNLIRLFGSVQQTLAVHRTFMKTPMNGKIGMHEAKTLCKKCC
jgi:hypothetical protein